MTISEQAQKANKIVKHNEWIKPGSFDFWLLLNKKGVAFLGLLKQEKTDSGIKFNMNLYPLKENMQKIVEDDKIGFISFHIIKKANQSPYTWLNNINVQESYSRQGLGEVLLSAMENIIQPYYVKQIGGSYSPYNQLEEGLNRSKEKMEKAEEFYDKNGYVKLEKELVKNVVITEEILKLPTYHTEKENKLKVINVPTQEIIFHTVVPQHIIAYSDFSQNKER